MYLGLIIAVVGGALGLLQTLVLFLLSDLRERIMRLETGQMIAAGQMAGQMLAGQVVAKNRGSGEGG